MSRHQPWRVRAAKVAQIACGAKSVFMRNYTGLKNELKSNAWLNQDGSG
jgi:hypothetical protein